MPHDKNFLSLPLRWAVVLAILAVLLPFQAGSVQTVQADSGCAAGKRCNFLPILTNGGNSTGDLQITSVEITQGVQNATNNVPLVAGRSTMLRIYASGQEALPAGSSNITVAISANPVGAAMSSAPLMLSGNLQVTPSRSVYTSTINVPLPDTWLAGSYDLSVTLDPQNQVPESNESNNTFVQKVGFINVPALQVMIVPVHYTHTDGHTYPAPTQDSISSWIMRLYPLNKVEISWHAPFAFNGNMKDVTSFSKLLSDINTIKKNEGAPAEQVYYALVPTTDGSLNWFSGGVVGIGYINNRVAVGLDYYNAGQTAAHEIGHNLGRYHAPCGSVSSPDPAYPYALASIGEFGLDLVTGQVYTPETGRDLMSYCSPKWISDYTYRALLDAQLQTASAVETVAADVQPGPVMMVRALVGADGAKLAPVYAVEGIADLPLRESEYHLQLLGADGQMLADMPVQALEIATDGEPAFEIQANLALPELPVQAVRLVKSGKVLVSSQLAVPHTSVAVRSAPGLAAASTALQASPDQRPAMVRYSLDGGQSWTTLAIDVRAGGFNVAGAGLPENALIDILPALSN